MHQSAERDIPRTRSRLSAAIAISAATTLALVGCAEGASTVDNGDAASTHTFSVASFLLDGTPNADMVHWFLDTVEERSEGRVTFDYFAAEALCPGAEIVQCVSDGRADMGVTVPTYTPDRFPLQNLAALPFKTDDNAALMAAFAQLGEEFPEFRAESERQGLKALAYWPAGASLFGSKVPLESVEDLRGISIRAVGDGLIGVLNAAGASPVALTAGEMYEAVDRGVIDAVANNIDAPISYRLTEVLDHWTDTGYGHYITIGMWMSQSAYESLPADLQAVVDEVMAELNGGPGIEAFAATAAGQCDYMLEQPNVTLTRWSDSEIQRFAELGGDAADRAFVESATAAGVPNAAEILERYEELLAERAGDESLRVAPLAECAERFLNER